MAVIKAKPERFVPLFLEVLDRELVTPQVVTLRSGADFRGAKGDMLNVKINGLRAVARRYEWRTRTQPIVLDDISGEGNIAIKLDTHTVSATSLTDEQMTLDDIDFTTDVLVPQAQAVVEMLESDVVYALTNAPFKRTFSVNAGADPLRVGAEAKRLLDADKVAPAGNRFFLIGTDVAAAWIASKRLGDYDLTGVAGTPAFREAVIGRIQGAPVVVSNTLPANFAYYGHKSAIVMANVAPTAPRGATLSRSGISRQGIGVRWLMDYDANYLRDRSIVSTFSGLTSIQDERKANGDLLDAGDSNFGLYNVRGLRFTVTGTGSVLTTEDKAA